MNRGKNNRLLLGLALVSLASLAYGEEPRSDAPASTAKPETVVVISAQESCKDMPAEQARAAADEAFQESAYQRAAECYIAAGEPALADKAYVRAAAQTRAETSRKLAANSAAVETQVHQLVQAFRRR